MSFDFDLTEVSTPELQFLLDNYEKLWVREEKVLTEPTKLLLSDRIKEIRTILSKR